MKKSCARLAAAAFVLALPAAAAAADDTRLSPIDVAADRTVDWPCERTGAPSFADLDRLGIGNRTSQYRRRIALYGLIRQTCLAHGDRAVLVLQPAGYAPPELVAIR